MQAAQKRTLKVDSMTEEQRQIAELRKEFEEFKSMYFEKMDALHFKLYHTNHCKQFCNNCADLTNSNDISIGNGSD